jgi:hypothetical protein
LLGFLDGFRRQPELDINAPLIAGYRLRSKAARDRGRLQEVGRCDHPHRRIQIFLINSDARIH